MTKRNIKFSDKEKYKPRFLISKLNDIKKVLLDLHPEKREVIMTSFRTLIVGVYLVSKKHEISIQPDNKLNPTYLAEKEIFDNLSMLHTKWLQLAVVNLDTKKKVFKPFWDNHCDAISGNLWYPENSPENNFWDSGAESVKTNTWFDMKTCKNPEPQESGYVFIPPENNEEYKIITRKIKLYPTTDQKKVLREWNHTRRYVYNKANAAIKAGDKPDYFKLLNKLVISKNNNLPEWELQTPKAIRERAVNDLVKNFKTCFSNLRNKNITHFKMGFCKRRHAPSIDISKQGIKMKDDGLHLFQRFLKGPIKTSKLKGIVFEYDCRLQIKNNDWYLIVPIKRKITKTTKSGEWCALDPGVRSFQTVYSENNITQIKIRKETIKKLQQKLDLFRSLRSRKIIKKSRFTRASRRIHKRVDNLVNDLHHKTCSYLTKTYNYIILPSFESQEMVKHSNNRYLNRDLLQLRHYQFQQRLKSHCELYGCTLDICTEEYTSKTCGLCGHINDVGCKDVISCTSCGKSCDRDVNGARNIGIKRLNEILYK